MRLGHSYVDDMAIIGLAILIWLCALATMIAVFMAVA